HRVALRRKVLGLRRVPGFDFGHRPVVPQAEAPGGRRGRRLTPDSHCEKRVSRVSRTEMAFLSVSVLSLCATRGAIKDGGYPSRRASAKSCSCASRDASRMAEAEDSSGDSARA